MTPTTLPQGAFVVYHPIVHNGPALVALFAMVLVGGMAGGAIVGLLLYAKAKGTVLWP